MESCPLAAPRQSGYREYFDLALARNSALGYRHSDRIAFWPQMLYRYGASLGEVGPMILGRSDVVSLINSSRAAMMASDGEVS